MYCRNCGKEIDDKAYVCVHCGVLTNNPQAQKSVQPSSTGVSNAMQKARSDFGKKSFYSKFCMVYPFVLIFLMIQKLVVLEIPILSYFGGSSKTLTVGLFDLYFKIPELKNKLDDYLYISDGVSGFYIIIMVIISVILLLLIANLIAQFKDIFSKNMSRYTPNFIIPIVFSTLFILAAIILKSSIAEQIEEYSGFNAAEMFSIYATPFVWLILIISIVGEVLKSKELPEKSEGGQSILFWDCPYCGTQNGVSSSSCSHCKKSRS